ncbi:MAG: hypothetical protein Q4G04_05735, partial [bacterium]|nr:hypothetical protein [bacterium]
IISKIFAVILCFLTHVLIVLNIIEKSMAIPISWMVNSKVKELLTMKKIPIVIKIIVLVIVVI